MKKKIAIMTGKMTDSGPARVSSNLSTYLPDNQYDKTVIVYDSNNPSYSFKGEIIDLKTKESKNYFRRIWNNIKRIALVKKLKNKKNIDVTISMLPNLNLINIFSRKNDLVIISVRSFMSKVLSGLHGYIYSLIFKHIYKRADIIIAVSKVVKQDLIDNFLVPEHKIKVIYNFYDIENIHLLADKEIENEEEKKIYNNPTVITVGRLMEQKGQWHLIRAFKRVKQNVPNAKLIILGQGNLESYLKELARNLDIIDDIHFLGFKDNPFKYISKADIYAFPSLYEGFPNALSEAMACGAPIISSDCESGPREILDPNRDINEPPIQDITEAEYGVLVPTCDGIMYGAEDRLKKEESFLAEAIVSLFNDNNSLKEYSYLSQQRVYDFNKENILQEWIDIINMRE